MTKKLIVALAVLIGGFILFYASTYTVKESEQCVIKLFGKVEKTVLDPGLHFKNPFADAVKYEKRWLEWDGDPKEITTADKRYISIDVFARWRIADLNVFVEKLTDEDTAQSRLDDIIDSATRNAIATHNLIEAIRSTNRDFVTSDEEIRAAGGQRPEARAEETNKESDGDKKGSAAEKAKAGEAKNDSSGDNPPSEMAVQDAGVDLASDERALAMESGLIGMTNMEDVSNSQEGDVTYEIDVGRFELTRLILKKASEETQKLGIELKDVQIKRIGYIEKVQMKVFDRMISERLRVAEAFRSQGQGLSAEILGRKERELRSIRSEAYRRAQEIKGRADAEAARIYADAYSKDAKFYRFLKTMESYEQTIDWETWILMTTDADYARLMRSVQGEGH